MNATTDLLDRIDAHAAEASEGVWRKGTTAWGTHNIYSDEHSSDITYPDGFKFEDDAVYAATVDPAVGAAMSKVLRHAVIVGGEDWPVSALEEMRKALAELERVAESRKDATPT